MPVWLIMMELDDLHDTTPFTCQLPVKLSYEVHALHSQYSAWTCTSHVTSPPQTVCVHIYVPRLYLLTIQCIFGMLFLSFLAYYAFPFCWTRFASSLMTSTIILTVIPKTVKKSTTTTTTTKGPQKYKKCPIVMGCGYYERHRFVQLRYIMYISSCAHQ